MLTSTSSDQLVNHEGVSRIEAEPQMEQVGEEEEEPKHPHQTE